MHKIILSVICVKWKVFETATKSRTPWRNKIRGIIAVCKNINENHILLDFLLKVQIEEQKSNFVVSTPEIYFWQNNNIERLRDSIWNVRSTTLRFNSKRGGNNTQWLTFKNCMHELWKDGWINQVKSICRLVSSP